MDVMIRTTVAMLLAAAGWGLATTALAQQATVDATTGCDGVVPSMPPPPYPDALKGTGIGGVVILIVSLDDCGRAINVSIEKTSRVRLLDIAAIEAEKTWVLPAQAGIFDGDAQRRARVPVDFTKAGAGFMPDPSVAISGRSRDEHFLARRSQKATLPPLLPDGAVPGYVPDPYPIGVSGATAAISLTERYGIRQPDPAPSVRVYQVADEEGLSFWVLDQSRADGTGVMRQRAVEDRGRGFYVTSLLCEPEASQGCEDFRAFVEKMPSQPETAPPLPPPPLEQ